MATPVVGVYLDESQDDDLDVRHVFVPSNFSGTRTNMDIAICGFSFPAGKTRSRNGICEACIRIVREATKLKPIKEML